MAEDESYGVNRSGYRGYIFSRPIAGDRIPQNVQNLVIRDYARRNGLKFKLSATELAVNNCYMMLQSVLDGLDELEGIILYSIFMLPEQVARRHRIYKMILDADATLYAAVENFKISTPADVVRLEEIIRLREATAVSTYLE